MVVVDFVELISAGITAGVLPFKASHQSDSSQRIRSVISSSESPFVFKKAPPAARAECGLKSAGTPADSITVFMREAMRSAVKPS
eukprot:SAG11_NODE_290_length_11190_cov_12.004872_2_plen_85_part_00